MQMPGRNGSLSGANYRYKFNGMEADGEVSGQGNSYTTQFRQYDPRLGRWKSLDPLASQFPWQSPFCGMDNNPISLIDPLGLEGTDPGEKESSAHKVDNIQGATEILDAKSNGSDVDDQYFKVGGNLYKASYSKQSNSWSVSVKTENGYQNTGIVHEATKKNNGGQREDKQEILEPDISIDVGKFEKDNSKGYVQEFVYEKKGQSSTLRSEISNTASYKNEDYAFMAEAYRKTYGLDATFDPEGGQFYIDGNVVEFGAGFNWGNEDLSIGLKGEFEALGGDVYGSDPIMIGENGQYGIKFNAGLDAYIMKAEAEGTISIFGLKITGTAGAGLGTGIGGTAGIYYDENSDYLIIEGAEHLGLGVTQKLGLKIQVPGESIRSLVPVIYIFD